MPEEIDLLTDVLYSDSPDNMGGITKNAFIGLVRDFTTIAKPDTSAGTPTLADRVTIKTPHVLAAAKKTYKLYAMYDKSGVTSELVGPRKSKSYKPKVKWFYPGNDAECIAFHSLIKNADLLGFAEPTDGEGLIQIGTDEFPASLVAGSVTTGEGPEGEKGIIFEIEAVGRDAWYLYTAELPRLGA